MPSAREASTVVTGETRSEFVAKRLNLAPESKAEPETKATETETKESKVEAKAEPEGKVEKVDPVIQKRFDELTFQREEAKREAKRHEDTVKSEREARQKAESEAAALKAKYEAPKEPDPRPTKESFKDESEYEKALEDWITDKANRERDAKEAQTRLATAWNSRVKATVEKHPDYHQVLDAADFKISDQMRDAIVESEAGPELQYYFAQNPEEATRFGQMTVRGMLIAMGKLEAKLASDPEQKKNETAETKPETKPEVKPVVVVSEISKAPAPETPLKGANAPVEVDPEKLDYQAWKAQRKAGKIR